MKALESERLRLRSYEEDDFEAVHSYSSSTENGIYLMFGPNSEDDTRMFIKSAIENAAKNPVTVYEFAVTLKDTAKLIGGCALHVSEYASEVGWLIHRDYWNKGYGTEIAKALLKFGFEELQIHRITARCDADNAGSSRLMEKIGMRKEGLFIDARPPHKKSNRPYSDELRYAILKNEWSI